MRQLAGRDRFGLGWRRDLSLGILSHLDEIDLVEVIADDVLSAPARSVDAIRTLARQVPVTLHGVSLGLASATPVDDRRLDAIAALVNRVAPESWSEHLAFVRAGGVELGHLAMPPRTERTIAGAVRNARRARDIVGAPPLLENVATLLDPPTSTHDEPSWTRAVVESAGAGLLLDVQNLHVNGTNLGFDAREALSRLPLDRVSVVHIAGGKWVTGPSGAERLLDDHLHPVDGAVYPLLTELGARAPGPLSVVLERDGRYPPLSVLLDELRRARAALATGRRLRGEVKDHRGAA